MQETLMKKQSASQSFFTLLILSVVCGIGLQLVIALVAGLIAGNMGVVVFEGSDQTGFVNAPGLLYASLIASSIGAFLLPAVILQKIDQFHHYFLQERNNIFLWCLVSVLFLFAFGPTMQLIGEANMNMSLPSALKNVEDWMRTEEDKMGALTQQLVMVDDYSKLILNILVMAVVPAIAEEFYFRGSLMNILQRAVKNTHVTIWITAFIFSAIHVQFFGFFPRMVLGAFFGYMLVWSRNIWVPVLAHFVNNATVTILAFYYTKQGKTYEDLQSYETYPIIAYLGSFILAVLIAVWSYKKLKENKVNGERLVENKNLY